MAAPTVVGSRAAESTSFGSTISVQTPTGATAASTLAVFLSGSSPFSAPSGWTSVSSVSDSGGAPGARIFIRPKQASAPASSYTFGHDGLASWVVLAIDGVDPDTAIDVIGSWSQDSTGTNTRTAPSLTTTTDDCLAIWFWGATPYQGGSEDDTWSSTVTSTDGTRRTTTTDYQAQLAAWQARPTAGATGTRTATLNNTSGGAVGKVAGGFALRGVAATGAPQTIEVGVVVEDEIPLSVTVLGGFLPPTPPRTYPITLAERREMLEASHVAFSLSRVEVLGHDDGLEDDDISDHIHACRIEHGGFRNINRIITIEVDHELDWGRQRIKPYLTVEGGGWSDTVSLGVFLMTAPALTGGVRPQHYDVQGYDKTYLLDQVLALPVSYPPGTPVLAAVRDLLSLRGMQTDRIDNSRATDTLTEARAWALEQGTTYLAVINDLLAMVGYRALRVDRDGLPESGPHGTAAQREIMWRYDAGSPTTTVHLTGRQHIDDYTDRPNRWVFWQNSTDRVAAPVEGDGLYIVDNLTEGLSSQNARGGLVITRAEGIEALTQSDLETNGDRIVAEDMESSATVRLTTDLNPYHDHQDIIEIIDRDLGVASPLESMVWSMDVFTRVMTHELRSIPGGIT